MSSERLQLYGLEANDSLGSDHFLFVADFRPAFVDADGNGLPDFWELVTFGDIGTYDAMEDLDSDGSNNLDEFYAGTDPQDKNSLFAIQEYTVDESEISISWNTITQRMYRLQGSFDLINWLGLNQLMQEPENYWNKRYLGISPTIFSIELLQSKIKILIDQSDDLKI